MCDERDCLTYNFTNMSYLPYSSTGFVLVLWPTKAFFLIYHVKRISGMRYALVFQLPSDATVDAMRLRPPIRK